MTRRAHVGTYVACVLASFAAGIARSLALAPIRWDFPDNAHYAAMASRTWRVGDAGPVLEPFPNPVLAPILAGLVARVSSLDVVSAMALINAVALGAIGLLLAV